MTIKEDICKTLLKEKNIIFVTGDVDTGMADSVISQILFAESNSNLSDIQLIINSPGGYVTDGMAIYDAMQTKPCDIITVATGEACSMGAILLSGGTKGKRCAFKNARMMIHQPSGGMWRSATDVQIRADEISRVKHMTNSILAKNTGQPYEKLVEDTERDFFMSSNECVDYGLIDIVLEDGIGVTNIANVLKNIGGE